MPDFILTKHCYGCKKIKRLRDFGRNKQSKDGLMGKCKECRNADQREYNKTEAGRKYNREYIKNYLTIEKNRKRVRATHARFRRTEKYKVIKRRYYYSEKGQAAAKKATEKAKESKRAKARQAVNHAVENGKIPRASDMQCQYPNNECEGRIEYHHHKGYSLAYYLDIIPLCRKHHCLVEGMNYHSV